MRDSNILTNLGFSFNNFVKLLNRKVGNNIF